MDYNTIYKGLSPDPLWTGIEIEQRIAQLAKEIEDAYLPGEIAIMPVLIGGMIFSSQLIQNLRNPIRVCPIYCQSYYGGMQPVDGKIAFHIPDAYNIPEKVLIVDDILDTGQTLLKLGEELFEGTKVREIKLCVLLHKEKVSQDTISTEFVGFRCPKNTFVVGFGMDYQGYFRNLRNIHEYTEVKSYV